MAAFLSPNVPPYSATEEGGFPPPAILIILAVAAVVICVLRLAFTMAHF